MKVVTMLALVGTVALGCQYKVEGSLPPQDTDIKSEAPIVVELKEGLKRLSKLPHGVIGVLEAHVLPEGAQLIVIGDLHGASKSLNVDIDEIKKHGHMNEQYKLNDKTYLVFTGDLADRGPDGIGVWHKVLMLQRINPRQVYIIHGNHESDDVATAYGLFDELLTKSDEQSEYEWNVFSISNDFASLFDRLPHAIFFGLKKPGSDSIEYIMTCHGGIEQRLNGHIEHMLNQVHDKGDAIETFTLNDLGNKKYCGLSWGDFEATVSNTPSERCNTKRSMRPEDGIFVHNLSFAKNYLQKIGAACIVCGHKHEPGGIVRLREQRRSLVLDDDCELLDHNKTQSIKNGSVFICTSSPEALGAYGCNEDAFACIENTKDGLCITPHILQRK